MATEKYSNLAKTNLAATIDNVTTTITVSDSSTFPASPQFRIIMDQEIMIVTSGGNTTETWTVTRAAEGTAAAAHNNGATIVGVLTTGAYDQLRADDVQIGTDGSIPSELNGRLYMTTDTNMAFYRMNGSWVGVNIENYSPLPTFTWGYQDTATKTVYTNKIVVVKTNTTTQTNEIIYIKKALPVTPYTVTAKIVGGVRKKDYLGYGLCLVNSTSGKLIVFAVQYNSGLQILLRKMDDPTTYDSDYVDVNTLSEPLNQFPEFFKISDDGSNKKFFYSFDGDTYYNFYTVSSSDFMTADQVGFCVLPEENASIYVGVGASLVSWKEEASA